MWREKGDEGDSGVMQAWQMRSGAAKKVELWVKAAFIFESGLAFFPSSKSLLMGRIIARLGSKIARFRSSSH